MGGLELRAANWHCPVVVLRASVLTDSLVEEDRLVGLLLVRFILQDNHALRSHLVIKGLGNACLAHKLLRLVA